MARFGRARKAGKEAKTGDGPLVTTRREALAPTDPWASLERDMEALRRQFFEPFFGPAGPRVGEALEWRVPPVDVRERDDAYEIRAELPGVTRDEVEVSVAPGRIEIRAEAGREAEEEREGYRYRETTRHAFHRTLPLPEDADATRAEARMKDGVLEINVPRERAGAERRRIPIQ